MSMMRNMVARPEKLQLRLIRLCMTMSSRFAMSVTQICILMAFALSPADGKLVGSVQSAYGSANIRVSPDQLYLVRVGDRTYKVAL